jgi:hypothetical protein
VDIPAAPAGRAFILGSATPPGRARIGSSLRRLAARLGIEYGGALALTLACLGLFFLAQVWAGARDRGVGMAASAASSAAAVASPEPAPAGLTAVAEVRPPLASRPVEPAPIAAAVETPAPSPSPAPTLQVWVAKPRPAPDDEQMVFALLRVGDAPVGGASCTLDVYHRAKLGSRSGRTSAAGTLELAFELREVAPGVPVRAEVVCVVPGDLAGGSSIAGAVVFETAPAK